MESVIFDTLIIRISFILCESGKGEVGSNGECEGVFYRVFAGTKDGARDPGLRDR